MKFKNKRAFFSNFILMLFSVFVPCIFFCTLISYLWMQQAQEDAFANDGMMLSLASRTFDTVLRDTTLAIGLMETDDQLTASLSSSSQELMNMSAPQFGTIPHVLSWPNHMSVKCISFWNVTLILCLQKMEFPL